MTVIKVYANVYHLEKRKGDNYNHVIMEGLQVLNTFEITSGRLPSFSKEDKKSILKYARENGFIPDLPFNLEHIQKNNLPLNMQSEHIHFSFPAKRR